MWDTTLRVLLASFILFCLAGWAEDGALKVDGPTSRFRAGETPSAVAQPAEPMVPRWFLLGCLVDVYPKLESERLIRQLLEPAMRLIAPGFEDVKTVGDLRNQGLLWAPHVGIGYVLSRRWAAFFQMGYAAGNVRTKGNVPSLLILPLKTNFEIFRGAFYPGVCVDFFPRGMPDLREYHGLWERLRHAQPVMGLRFTETYATYRVKAQARFADFPNFLDVKLKDAWWVPSINANVGVDIPLDRHNVLTFNAGYNFSMKRAYDFDGVAITAGWKHFFK